MTILSAKKKRNQMVMTTKISNFHRRDSSLQPKEIQLKTLDASELTRRRQLIGRKRKNQREAICQMTALKLTVICPFSIQVPMRILTKKTRPYRSRSWPISYRYTKSKETVEADPSWSVKRRGSKASPQVVEAGMSISITRKGMHRSQ